MCVYVRALTLPHNPQQQDTTFRHQHTEAGQSPTTVCADLHGIVDSCPGHVYPGLIWERGLCAVSPVQPGPRWNRVPAQQWALRMRETQRPGTRRAGTEMHEASATNAWLVHAGTHC